MNLLFYLPAVQCRSKGVYPQRQVTRVVQHSQDPSGGPIAHLLHYLLQLQMLPQLRTDGLRVTAQPCSMLSVVWTVLIQAGGAGACSTVP